MPELSGYERQLETAVGATVLTKARAWFVPGPVALVGDDIGPRIVRVTLTATGLGAGMARGEDIFIPALVVLALATRWSSVYSP